MGKEKPGPLFVTRPQLAGIFGKDPRTIARWLEEGLPVAQPGRGGKAALFEVGRCVQWVIQREIAAVMPESDGFSPQQERARLDRSRREELELRLKTRRGELVEVEEVERDFTDVANAVRARMRRIPDAVADRVGAIATQGPMAVKTLLLSEIDEALRELASRADRLAGERKGAA